MLHRSGNSFVPNHSTRLENGDHLTIIGQPEGLTELKNRYLPIQPNTSAEAPRSNNEMGLS
jgi:Trk K+ transport system NAD-binding subunit